MNTSDDPFFEALRGLPDVRPDPRRTARTRALCRERILGRAKRKRVALRLFDAAAAAALGVYLVSVLQATLRLAIGG